MDRDRGLEEKLRAGSRPLLVVDGDSFAHRAYHALPKSIRRAERRPAGALVGFANMLDAAVGGRAAARRARRLGHARGADLPARGVRRPTSRAACSTRRCSSSSALLPELVASFGFAVAEGAGYEADDFLAAAADAETDAAAGARRDLRPRRVPARARAVTILQPRARRERARADRPGGGARALRRRAGAGARLHRAARRPVGQDPGARGVGAKTAASILAAVRLARGGARGGPLLGQADDLRLYRRIATDGRLCAAPAAARTRSRTGRARRSARALGAGSARRAPRGEGRGIDVVSTRRWSGSTRPGTHPESPERQRVLLERFRSGRRPSRRRRTTSRAATTRVYIERIRDISGPTWLDPRHDRLRDELRGALLLAAGRRSRPSARRPSRSAARPATTRSRPRDGLLPLRQRRRSPPAMRRPSSASSAWRSSTGTSTTATARRRSSGTTRRVFFASLHQWPFYPGSGGPDEQGETTLNVPLPAGSGDDDYLRAFAERVEPAVAALRPRAGARLGRLRRARGGPARR